MKITKKILTLVLFSIFLYSSASYAIVENPKKKSHFTWGVTKIFKKDTKKQQNNTVTPTETAPFDNKDALSDTTIKLDDSISASDSQEIKDLLETEATIDGKTVTAQIKEKDKKKNKAKNKNAENEQNIFDNSVHSTFSLDDCIKIAIEYNPEVRSAVYNAIKYQTKIGQAWSSYFPKITLGIDVARDGTNYSKAISSNMVNTGSRLPQVAGDMLLFDFGKTKANADSAKKSFEAKETKTQEDINTLIYKIKSNYYNTLFAQAKVKVYEDTVADYELQRRQAQSFYETGKKAKIDVITADYNLGKAKLNLVKAKNDLDLAWAELSKVMGIPEYTNFDLGSKLGTNRYYIEQEEAIKKAFEVRPELITAFKDKEAAKLALRSKQREYTPNLSAFGTYGNLKGNEYDQLTYRFGVALGYTDINLMKVKKQVDEADATYKKAIADYETVKHNVYINVKKAYLKLKTAEEAIIIAKLALDEAKEQYRQAAGRYKAGVGDIIELKDAENTFLNARLDFYNALLTYNTDAANLEKEIGTPIHASNDKVLINFVD